MGRRQRFRAIAVATAVVVAIAVSLYRSQDRTTPSRSWTTTLVPQSPLAARTRPALVWIDDALLVWGGDDDYVSRAAQAQDRQTFYSDGAIYRPGSRRWIPMPVSPFGPSQSPPRAVVAGHSAVVWRGSELAVFDMAAMTWTAHRPFTTTIAAIAWTGTELLVVGPDVAVDLEARTRRSLAKSKAAFVRPDAIWTDAGLVVIGRTPEDAAAVFVLDKPDRSGVWRSVAPEEFSHKYVAAARLGSKIFVVLWTSATGIDTLEFAPKINYWVRVAAPKAHPAIWFPNVTVNGADVLLLRSGEAFIRSNRKWVVVEPLPGIGVVAAGADGAFWAAGMAEGETALKIVEIHR